MQKSDRDLVIACRRGDQTAWETLVHRYERLIYTIPRRAGLNEDLAAEIFQDVFATLLEKIDEIEDPARLKAWMVTTAKRKTWRVTNREKRTEGFDAADEAEGDAIASIPDQSPLADDVLIELERQHVIRVAISALDERCRELITMLFYQAEPPPYSVIAERIGISEGSIGPTRARCLKKLMKLLEI
jgi:RNA polymerase sigma factor (sigma-70 family)